MCLRIANDRTASERPAAGRIRIRLELAPRGSASRSPLELTTNIKVDDLVEPPRRDRSVQSDSSPMKAPSSPSNQGTRPAPDNPENLPQRETPNTTRTARKYTDQGWSSRNNNSAPHHSRRPAPDSDSTKTHNRDLPYRPPTSPRTRPLTATIGDDRCPTTRCRSTTPSPPPPPPHPPQASERLSRGGIDRKKGAAWPPFSF